MCPCPPQHREARRRRGDLTGAWQVDEPATALDLTAADPRAVALIDNFAGQWWLIRNVELAFKDVLLYPQWDDGMKASMRTELRMFAESFFAGERSMLEMLTAKKTFVDQRLAAHYGIQGAFSEAAAANQQATSASTAAIHC